jgi:hypothetical protein
VTRLTGSDGSAGRLETSLHFSHPWGPSNSYFEGPHTYVCTFLVSAPFLCLHSLREGQLSATRTALACLTGSDVDGPAIVSVSGMRSHGPPSTRYCAV